MTGKTIIDIQNWSRKEHYSFFSSLPDPFFGLTAKADFTDCYNHAKANGGSFFLYALHRILGALNSIPEFRTRIENGQVVMYDYIGVSSTIAREDGSFGFAYIEWNEDFEEFAKGARTEVERVKNGTGLSVNENESRVDIVYFTAIPWLDFTSIKHPGGRRPGDSIPQIAVGKLHDEGDRKVMSVAVEANHGLVDGRHVGLFFDALK